MIQQNIVCFQFNYSFGCDLQYSVLPQLLGFDPELRARPFYYVLVLGSLCLLDLEQVAQIFVEL